MSPEHQHQLSSFASDSRRLLLGLDKQNSIDLTDPLGALIDGQAIQVINAMLGRDRRRSDGIFFSGSEWAARLREAMPHDLFLRYVDPSCGVGDLLLEIARHLPLANDLSQTITEWSHRFHGMDVHAPLAQVAWSRLQALAVRRHGLVRGYSDSLCIEEGALMELDSLKERWNLQAGDCVLMNPPFQAVTSPTWSKYSRGRVTAAALFLERAISEAQPGTTIIALLPEVIRSGSRFEKLRDFVHRSSDVHQFTAHGRFSHEADIDVAILSITVGATSHTQPKESAVKASAKILGDIARIRVGTIVPHRAKSTRLGRPYLDVEGAPIWREIVPSTKKDYVGTAFVPPFVVVRRTSGPGDRERARATLVRGNEPIIVENHLLVLIPNKRTLKSCRELMRILKNVKTTAWFNEMLRCRHLTVKVMEQLPVWEET